MVIDLHARDLGAEATALAASVGTGWALGAASCWRPKPDRCPFDGRVFGERVRHLVRFEADAADLHLLIDPAEIVGDEVCRCWVSSQVGVGNTNEIARAVEAFPVELHEGTGQRRAVGSRVIVEVAGGHPWMGDTEFACSPDGNP